MHARDSGRTVAGRGRVPLAVAVLCAGAVLVLLRVAGPGKVLSSPAVRDHNTRPFPLPSVLQSVDAWTYQPAGNYDDASGRYPVNTQALHAYLRSGGCRGAETRPVYAGASLHHGPLMSVMRARAMHRHQSQHRLAELASERARNDRRGGAEHRRAGGGAGSAMKRAVDDYLVRVRLLVCTLRQRDTWAPT